MLTIFVIQGIFYFLIWLIWGTVATDMLWMRPNIIINVVSVIIWIFTNIWWKNINLQVATKWSALYIDFWNKMPKLFFKLLWTVILYALVIVILFIIPWLIFAFWSGMIFLMVLAGILWLIATIFVIIFAIRIQFFIYIVIDKKARGHKALRQSRDITKWHLRELIWFSMAKFVLLMFGMILAFIGLLRAIPACQIATADVYRKLTWSTKSAPIIAKTAVKKPVRTIKRVIKKTK
jgi:hypothetical protein